MYGESLVNAMIFLNLCFDISNTKICERSGALECCPGYIWNRIENRCIPCDDGYIGQNCSDPCPPPYFGKECTSTCNCTDHQYCHHVHGCTQPQGDACQKPVTKTEEHTRFSSSVWTAVVCLLIISIILFTFYVYIKFVMNVDL